MSRWFLVFIAVLALCSCPDQNNRESGLPESDPGQSNGGGVGAGSENTPQKSYTVFFEHKQPHESYGHYDAIVVVNDFDKTLFDSAAQEICERENDLQIQSLHFFVGSEYTNSEMELYKAYLIDFITWRQGRSTGGDRQERPTFNLSIVKHYVGQYTKRSGQEGNWNVLYNYLERWNEEQ